MRTTALVRLPVLCVLAIVVLVVPSPAVEGTGPPNGTEETDPRSETTAPALLIVDILSSEPVHFHPAAPDTYASPGVTVEDNGRVVVKSVAIEPPDWPHRIFARVSTVGG